MNESSAPQSSPQPPRDTKGRAVVAGPTSRRVIAPSGNRVRLLAVLGGVLVLAFILLAVQRSGREIARQGLLSTIVEKVEQPTSELQISVGSKGLQREDVTERLTFRVQVPTENNREYIVPVTRTTFDQHKVGDTYYIVVPPGSRKPFLPE